MTNSDWYKVDFKQFVSEFGIELVIKSAPKILYPKKDKEHEAVNSMIGFLFAAALTCGYIAIALLLAPIWFSLNLFITFIIIGTTACIVLILNYVKSSVFIRPMECWVEIFRSTIESDYFCFLYFPIFSGKCLPNKAKNVVYKLYQEEILKSRIDITQIELYINVSKVDKLITNYIGYYFQYGEGKSFKDENINRNAWRFFPSEKSVNDNYIAVANWDHQYEWRNDLNLDFDKLHVYAPWIIKSWTSVSLKPLTEEYKEIINWKLRYIQDTPKLTPWIKAFEENIFESKDSHRDLEIIEEAITKIIGDDFIIESLKDLKKDLFQYQAYFRDLKL